jgi:ATP-binding cassette subfamily B protein
MPPFIEEFEDEDPKARTGSLALLRKFAPLILPHWPQFALSVVLLLLAIAGELAGPLILRLVIDEAVPSRDSGAIIRYSLVFAGIFGATMVFAYLQVMLAARIGLSVVRDLKRQLFDHVLTLSMAYFNKNPSGRLMARVESDAERVRMLFSETSMALLRNAAMVAGTVVVMLLADPAITFKVMLIVLPAALLSIPVLKKMRVLWGDLRKSYASISGSVAEFVRAVPVMQVFGTTGYARTRIHRLGMRFVKREIRATIWDYGFWSFLGALEIAAVAVILTAGRPGVVAGTVTVGTVVLFVEYTRRLFGPLVMFGETLNQMQRALASGDRLMELIHTETLTPDGHLGPGHLPRGWTEIRFEDVWFSYSGEEWVIRGLSFSIHRGETVALVGDSGGGKSTLVALLLRFYHPVRGRITIDGTDIREFTLDAWRSRIGLVLQEVNLFSGTLSGNLTVFDPSVGRAEQEEALGQIEALELLERIPGGLDGEISEGGVNLSMGQRQLVNIARAVLRKPDILVLDEATSSVDPGTEKKLQRATDLALSGRTALVVAHRLSTIIHSDRILVVRGGLLVEQGTHAELMSHGGVYASLFILQFGGEESA